MSPGMGLDDISQPSLVRNSTLSPAPPVALTPDELVQVARSVNQMHEDISRNVSRYPSITITVARELQAADPEAAQIRSEMIADYARHVFQSQLDDSGPYMREYDPSLPLEPEELIFHPQMEQPEFEQEPAEEAAVLEPAEAVLEPAEEAAVLEPEPVDEPGEAEEAELPELVPIEVDDAASNASTPQDVLDVEIDSGNDTSVGSYYIMEVNSAPELPVPETSPAWPAPTYAERAHSLLTQFGQLQLALTNGKRYDV